MNEKEAKRTIIKHFAEWVTNNVRGGYLFGEPIDETDPNALIAAAYYFGRSEGIQEISETQKAEIKWVMKK